MSGVDVHTQIANFLAANDGELTFSPGSLQDLLFDCWGALKDTPAQTLIEEWLGLTVERHMFSSTEVHDVLSQISDLGDSVPVSV